MTERDREPAREEDAIVKTAEGTRWKAEEISKSGHSDNE